MNTKLLFQKLVFKLSRTDGDIHQTWILCFSFTIRKLALLRSIYERTPLSPSVEISGISTSALQRCVAQQ